MLAAWRAATLGHRVVLLEANRHLGAKLRISGGGKCNLTHDGNVKAVLEAFPKEQGRFLKRALHAFSNDDLRNLLRSAGVETYVRENGRVFPVDCPGSAVQVVAALEAFVLGSGVDVKTNVRVSGMLGAPPHLEALQMEDGTLFKADFFILATGGASYPETGTRGEILAWLRELGVPVNPWFPALAPIPLKQPRPEWEGVALRGGTLCLSAGKQGKRLARVLEDILFTRAGISGPAALALSSRTEHTRRGGPAWLSYALVSETPEALDAKLVEAQHLHPHLLVRTWLQEWLPERLVQEALVIARISAMQRLKDLPRKARQDLRELLLAFPLGEPGSVPLSRGEVSAGGVCLETVDPGTMALKGWDNLRCCGELLDVDGPIGGYNLQAAFSTGYIAGSIPSSLSPP